MTKYNCYFSTEFSGVSIVVTLTHESKHFPLITLNAACEDLAIRLNATFLYYEEV